MRKTVARAERALKPIPTTTSKSARAMAQLVLEVLDKIENRGGRAFEFREGFSDGLVRIQRIGKRVHFRTPRAAVSIRLSPNRSKTLLLARNVRPLEGFLEDNPLVLAFLDEQKLRGA